MHWCRKCTNVCPVQVLRVVVITGTGVVTEVVAEGKCQLMQSLGEAILLSASLAAAAPAAAASATAAAAPAIAISPAPPTPSIATAAAAAAAS